MTTGIYTTKWFLQCFIDRVRSFVLFFVVVVVVCFTVYAINRTEV